jgi:5-methylcytosine-specific restriction endonuclease McrA
MGNKFALGRKHTPGAKEKDRQAHLGKPLKPATVALLRDGRRKGENNANWRGGISSLPHLLRTNFQYRQWRSDIFTRDNFSCMICGDYRGRNLHAHHHPETLLGIIAKYKIETIEQALLCEKLWDINNGVTLCDECHRQIHSKPRAA